MEIKPGADLRGLNWRMRRVLRVAEHVWQTYGYDLVVTCGLDGDHSKWSWHYYGMAVDLRTRDMPVSVQKLVEQDMRQILGRPYQVVLEASHMHVECDLDANHDLVGEHPG